MKKTFFQKLTALIVMLGLLIPASAGAFSLFGLFGGDDEPAPSVSALSTATVETEQTPAPDILQSEITDDGLLRVYLKSMSDLTALTLTLEGEYSLNGSDDTRFARGTSLVISAADKAVYLNAGGLILNLGQTLTLTRRASSAAVNGIYIEESEKSTLYAGDLTASVNDDGTLRAVLTLPIEDYLYGVVAYEMNDSWPLEALKAQAVAARTYAMQRAANSASRDYDVVDTTGDQVFKGFDPEYTNVIRAVDETRGIVGTYKGAYASCFYTASNGGQTALANDIWGGEGDYGYMEMKDDPYDLENTKSMVSELFVSPDVHESEKLKRMLVLGLAEAMQAQNIEGGDPQIESIAAIEPVEPAFEGSKMYTKLRFDLTVSVKEPAYLPRENDVGAPAEKSEDSSANAALAGIDLIRRLMNASPYVLTDVRRTLDAPVSVMISVYDQIKDELGLSLNGRDYEVVSVQERDGGFSIEMRRFGHGVGMSQRGAQDMAGQHDFNFSEILNFYYPGMTLERIDWETPELSALPALPEGVLAQAEPAPLRELNEGEYYAVVALGNSSSRLNLRSAPNTEASVVTKLKSGRRVIVTSEVDADGWVSIETGEYSGYAKLEYLQSES